ncbi:MAG: hypothetical protein EOO52_06795 [Gammaproteobacteria bacterium]|nr:MAG: hypothetical protein EOO52_06795 [Gammaproteobacteria bacterium]
MSKNLSIILIIFTSCSQLCLAEEDSNIVVTNVASSAAINDNGSTAKEMPVITNEAEYAKWIESRDKINQSSSGTSLSASSSSIRMASSAAKKAVK